MINAHMASKAQSAQAEAVISRPGMVTFWILFATISLVVSLTLGIAIASIPAKVPLTPVSYTHLDVYKRQDYGSFRRFK